MLLFFHFAFMQLIFLYFMGRLIVNSSQNLLISKPLQVELKFESEIKSAKQETVNPKSLESLRCNKPPKQLHWNQVELKPVIQESILYSNLSDLLEQEESIMLSQEQEQIFFYSSKNYYNHRECLDETKKHS